MRETISEEKIKLVDLFSGAGGLSLGFMKTGKFDLVAAAENDKYAQETYVSNHETNADFVMISDVVGYDFTKLTEQFGEIDIVIGGPPCQGFSNSNRQKNYIISKNNSLVKEFFRAIIELKPKAFVMENVEMFESNTHRFYDSTSDHNFIKSLGIALENEKVPVSTKSFEELDMLNISQSPELVDSLLLPEKLNNLLRVFNKHKNNETRRVKYIEKNRKVICNQIEQYFCSPHDSEFGAFIDQRLQDVYIGLKEQKDFVTYRVSLSDLMDLQKTLRTIEEIYDNEIICHFELSDDKSLSCTVHSYTVIDYINAVLNGEYFQNSSVINARWFDIPQERKRFIFGGIRNDIMKDPNGTVRLPLAPLSIKDITVADAIFDLLPYEVSYDAFNDKGQLFINQNNLSDYAKSMRDSEMLHNHIVTNTTAVALERFRAIEEGENFHSLDANLKKNYSDPARTQKTIYLRLKGTEPSGTVVNVRKSMWIHPRLDRAVSVREAARLQSFPDSFVFKGTKDSQYQQVGNAVPPLMAKAIAECILEYL